MAYPEDVEALFWARYDSFHVGHTCPTCESEYESRVNREYCRICFESEIWAADHEFMDANATLAYLFNHYKFERYKCKSEVPPTTPF